MVSGKITNNYTIISSLVSSSVLQTTPTITVNPRCRGISKSNHYFAPSLAVSPKTLSKVMAAERVVGRVNVEKVSHKTHDILVGNTATPRILVFAHYDSIGPGVIDNASGVAVMMDLVLREPTLREEVLFVFAANEELSYDLPVYWGHGFRDFEKERPELFERAAKILVIDSMGHSRAKEYTDPGLVKLAFPLLNAERFAPKITLVAGDFDALMKVYHSDLDNGATVTEAHLRQAVSVARTFITRELDK
jgi:Iap family predicted aminopeptidase